MATGLFLEFQSNMVIYNTPLNLQPLPKGILFNSGKGAS